MRAKGLREIKTAFDMDMRTNPYVQEAYQKLLELLNSMGFRYGTYLWDENYKGLDDYLWATIINNKGKRCHSAPLFSINRLLQKLGIKMKV